MASCKGCGLEMGEAWSRFCSSACRSNNGLGPEGLDVAAIEEDPIAAPVGISDRLLGTECPHACGPDDCAECPGNEAAA